MQKVPGKRLSVEYDRHARPYPNNLEGAVDMIDANLTTFYRGVSGDKKIRNKGLFFFVSLILSLS